MVKAHLSNSEISRRGHPLYEQELRQNVETEENIGKILVLDVANGHYEIDPDGIQASKRLQARYPDTDPYDLFAMRIGYDAVFAIGTTLTRTSGDPEAAEKQPKTITFGMFPELQALTEEDFKSAEWRGEDIEL